MKDSKREGIVAAVIIVLFHPSEDDVTAARYMAEAYEGVVADNSPTPTFHGDHVGRMHYLFLGGNKGIAEAHNRAISLIESEGHATHIVLLDQDSRTGQDFPERMVREFEAAQSATGNLAALGPTVVQKDTGETYRSAFHREEALTEHFAKKYDIIASGCCISIDSLRQVGLFDSRLFIDFVDTEWCHRAQSMGLVCGTTPQIHILHKVGIGELHFGRHIVSLATPPRYFYQYRNFILLLCRPYVPARFKVCFGVKLTARLFYLPFVHPEGWSSLKAMLRGIREGVCIVITSKDT